MPTLADVLRNYTPPTESALADPIKEHFATLPQQLATNQAALDRAIGSWNKTDFATGQQNPNYRPEAMQEFTQMMPIAGTIAKALPRKELIEQQITALENTGRAKAGGQVADSNGFFYKGGQFLPNTNAEPGKWKINGKWVKSGTELIEPGVRANAPTPFSRSILNPLREYVDYVDGDFKKLKLKEGMKVLGKTGDDGLQHYEPVTLDTTWTPRLADYEHHTPVTIGELIDAYNKGQRWFDVKPNAVTITTKD
jgi:hypothetical protein